MKNLNDYDMDIRACTRDSPEWKDAVYRRGLKYEELGRYDDADGDFIVVRKFPDGRLPLEVNKWIEQCKAGRMPYVETYAYISTIMDALSLPFANYPKITQFMEDMSGKNIFPNLMVSPVRTAFYSKIPYLYHAVPEDYATAFESGFIVLDKASNVRATEDGDIGKFGFFSEGMSISNTTNDICSINCSRFREFFFLCFSFSKDISRVRSKINTGSGKRVLYQVNMKKMLHAILGAMRVVNGCVVQEGGGWAYQKDGELSEKSRKIKDLRCTIAGGEVMYFEDCDGSPQMLKDICFHKHNHFASEREFRFVFTFKDMSNIRPNDIFAEPDLLGTTNGKKVILNINPDECFRRMT